MAGVHIGKKIREILSNSKYSVTEFAERINKTRSVVYDIFKRDSIDTALLMQIGQVLDHDFFQYLSPEKFKEERSHYQKKRDAELHAELERCRQHIIELEKKNLLLEKLVRLLEEKNQGLRKLKKK